MISMFMAALILIVSTALFLFYLQVTCQRILRRKFDKECFHSVAAANNLEFPAVRKALEDFDAPVEYDRYRTTLKCDYLALAYLLKNAVKVNQRYSREERLLMLHFRVITASLAIRHLLRLREKAAILKLTAILQYFANVVAERIKLIRCGDVAGYDHLSNT